MCVRSSDSAKVNVGTLHKIDRLHYNYNNMLCKYASKSPAQKAAASAFSLLKGGSSVFSLKSALKGTPSYSMSKFYVLFCNLVQLKEGK